MNLVTLGTAKTKIARVLGVCTTDSAVAEYLNEAQERLLNRPGKPVGSYVRYAICVNDSCLTWPRQIRSIEAFAVCDTPGQVHSSWYEFLTNGPGMLHDDDMPGTKLVDREMACTFDDITAGEVDRNVRVTTDVAETAGTYIWLYGNDENGNWIRSQIGGVWYDGERIDLSTAPVNSTHFFTSLVRVNKAATNGIVRLYEWNSTTAAVVKALAYYEPSETLPIYRRSFIPGLADMQTCENSTDDCDNRTVTVLARLQHIPVSADNDFLVIGNLPALKLMVMAIKAEEDGDIEKAQVLEAKAQRELDGELAAYLGDGQMPDIRVEDRSLFGGGGVENVIS